MGALIPIGSLADKAEIETIAYTERATVGTVYQALTATAAAHGARPGVSFQIKSGPKDKAETLTWHGACTVRSRKAANLFRSLGIGDDDVVAYLLPNCNETAITLLAGATAGIVNPINPLLDAEHIGALLRETNAKVLVTLTPFPKTDVAQKAHEAAALAPNVKTVLEVDLKRYLTPPLSWIVPLIRPKLTPAPGVQRMNFNQAVAKQDGDQTELCGEPGPRTHRRLFPHGRDHGHAQDRPAPPAGHGL